MQVQSCPGVQTHGLMNVVGQHHATESIGTDAHPASTKRPPLLMPEPVQVQATGGSDVGQVIVLRAHPVMHSAPPSFVPPDSRPKAASAGAAPASSGVEASVVRSASTEVAASGADAAGVLPEQSAHTSPWHMQVWPQPSDGANATNAMVPPTTARDPRGMAQS